MGMNTKEVMRWTHQAKTKHVHTAIRGEYTLTITQMGTVPVVRWTVQGHGLRGAEGKAPSVDEGKKRALQALELVIELQALAVVEDET